MEVGGGGVARGGWGAGTNYRMQNLYSLFDVYVTVDLFLGWRSGGGGWGCGEVGGGGVARGGWGAGDELQNAESL